MSIITLAANAYNKLTKQEGQGIIEYVLLISLIAISLISSLMLFKDTILHVLNAISYTGGNS